MCMVGEHWEHTQERRLQLRHHAGHRLTILFVAVGFEKCEDICGQFDARSECTGCPTLWLHAHVAAERRELQGMADHPPICLVEQ